MDGVMTPPTAPPAPDATAATPAAPKSAMAQAPDSKTVVAQFKSAIDISREHLRRNYIRIWKRNIETRLGRAADLYTGGIDTGDDQRTELNPDWSLTKTKTANLFSQVPTVQLTPERDDYKAAIAIFGKALMYELGEKRAKIAVPMEEVLNDVVNASGIGGVFVGYAARFDQQELPTAAMLPMPDGSMQPTSSLPPQVIQTIIQQSKAQGIPFPTQMVSRTTDSKFYFTRLSPGDLLTPKGFTGSDFNDADWVGRTVRDPWGIAAVELGLTDEQKRQVLSSEDRRTESDLRSNPGTDDDPSETVVYDDVYYWRHRVDPTESNFKSIWRIVFVHGLKEPVKHELWKGQQRTDNGKYVGACKYPIQFLTLTYVSDNPIPPSDTEAGRPQVLDMRLSRSQMFQNRAWSTPMRWADTNRIDPAIMDLINKGQMQRIIPVNGSGERAMGEIARAAYPSEDMAFDRMAKTDLMESWQIGPNQNSSTAGGDTTKGEAELVQANFSTRIGQERARVATFFVNLVEVLAGLMILYSDFPNLTDQERGQMQQVWDQKHILHDVVFKVRPDSTVALDAKARIKELMNLLNMTVKSGFVNPAPIIAEIVELYGFDPGKIMTQPTPHEEKPKMSFTFAGKDDLINPLVMALLIKSQEAPNPQELQQAITLLKAAQIGLPPGTVQPPGAPGPGGPGGPPAPGGPQAPVGAPPMAPGGAGAHPQWALSDKVAQRSRDMEG